MLRRFASHAHRDDVAKCDANGGCSCVLIFRNYHTDDDYKPFDVASYTDGA